LIFQGASALKAKLKLKGGHEMSNLKHAFIVLIGSLLLAGAAWAQVNRGSITGIVTDPSGAVVANVAITVSNPATGVTNNVTTNSSGV